MARLFDDASSEYLEVASVPHSSYPFAFTAWGYCDDASGDQTIICIADSSSTSGFAALMMREALGGDSFAAFEYTGGGLRQATLATGWSANTWHHISSLFVSASDRRVLSGGNRSTNSDSAGSYLGSVDVTGVARASDSSPRGYLSGRAASVAMWDLSVYSGASDSDKADYFETHVVAALESGAHPFSIPMGLVAYWPLLRTDQDLVGGYDMTAYNSPTWADHPSQVWYPPGPNGLWLASAEGGALAPSVSDSLTLGESLSASIGALGLSISDAITLGESLTARLGIGLSVSDSATLGESVGQDLGALLASITDSLTLGEAIAAAIAAALGLSVSDAVTLGESINAALGAVGSYSANVSDAVTLGDSVDLAMLRSVSVSDGVSLGEAVSAALTAGNELYLGVSEALTLGEVVAAAMAAALGPDVSEGVSVGETVAAALANLGVHISDAMTLGEAINMVLPDALTASATEALTLGEIISAVLPEDLASSVSDNLTLGESINAGVGLGPRNISVSDNLTLGERAAVASLTLAAVITEEIALGETVTAGGLSEILLDVALTDALVALAVLSDALVNNVALSDATRT